MRRALLVSSVLAISAGCGRTDIVVDPGADIVEREVTLDDGDAIWLEVLVEEDFALLDAVNGIEDGITLDGLVDTVAMGEPHELVFDTRDEPTLIVEVAGDPRAWVYR